MLYTSPWAGFELTTSVDVKKNNNQEWSKIYDWFNKVFLFLFLYKTYYGFVEVRLFVAYILEKT